MGVFQKFDQRFSISKRHPKFGRRNIPEHLNITFCFGGIAFCLFLLSVLSGLLLSLYYVPSAIEAFPSIANLQYEVPLGRYIRSVHKWSAHLLVIFIFLHMVRVVVYRAYLKPRELHWFSGIILMLLVAGSGFTGYLLPWDQKAYWATRVGTTLVEKIPFIGDYIALFLRGGMDVSGATLTRFFAFHVLFLPILITLFLWMHFHMIKRTGVKADL